MGTYFCKDLNCFADVADKLMELARSSDDLYAELYLDSAVSYNVAVAYRAGHYIVSSGKIDDDSPYIPFSNVEFTDSYDITKECIIHAIMENYDFSTIDFIRKGIISY